MTAHSRWGRYVLGVMVGVTILVPEGALAASPTVTAGTASASSATAITLTGTVDTSSCGSSATSWHFEFGSEQPSNYSYDPSNAANPNPFTGSSPRSWGFVSGGTAGMAVSTAIPTDTGGPPLTVGIVYYWRLVGNVQNVNPPPPNATCAGGAVDSSVQCFKLGQGSVPCPPQVSATFMVVNKRGRPQDAYVHVAFAGNSSGNGYPTTPDGTFTTTVQPGEVLRFSRTPDENDSCAAPEGGSPGFLYTVPDNPPSQVTLQLENTTASDAPETPSLSLAERWVVGKINDMRLARGLPRLQISTTLDRVAYATAHDAAALRSANGSYPWPPKFCAAVGDDWGWPQLALGNRAFGGNDDATTSAAHALAHWTDTSATDTGAKARTGLTFNSAATDIGIADGGTAWTMFVGDCSDHSVNGQPLVPGGPKPAPLSADVAARCELTSDTGDATIQLPPSSTGTGGTTGTGGSGNAGNGGGTSGQPNAAAPTVRSLLTGLSAGLAHLSRAVLLKTGEAKVTFIAARPGYAAAGCSIVAHRHRLQLLGGQSRVLRAGTVTLHLRLTGPGRTLLRNRRPVRASCQAMFAPRHGAAVRKTTRVTFGR